MALGPTQPPIWWVQEFLSQGKSGWGVRLSLPPSSAEGKNGCVHICSALYAFMAYISVDLTFKNRLLISIDVFVQLPFIINWNVLRSSMFRLSPVI